MKLHHVFAFAAACFAASGALAQAKPEDQIKYRQSSMVVTARSNAVLNSMAKGDIPFNKEIAQQHASTIATLSDLPLMAGAYGPGTDKAAPTKAGPRIWSEADKFKLTYEKFTAAARALPAAAVDQASLKVALADFGKTCKGCHDDYRMK